MFQLFPKRRAVYFDSDFADSKIVKLDKQKANHLRKVLRLEKGANLLVFNKSSRVFEAVLKFDAKNTFLEISQEVYFRSPNLFEIHLCLSPFKKARLESLMEKITELGVNVVEPLVMEHTQNITINRERTENIFISAAQQSHNFNIPRLAPPKSLADFVFASFNDKTWGNRLLFLWFDEQEGKFFHDFLEEYTNDLFSSCSLMFDDVALSSFSVDFLPKAAKVIIGPEGGFSDKDRFLLNSLPNCHRINLGANILRCETAAIIALGLVHLLFQKISVKFE